MNRADEYANHLEDVVLNPDPRTARDAGAPDEA